MNSFDINRVRKDFPILAREVYGNPLVYLDNGATTQKPQSVIDAIVHYYSEINSNVHRGVHHLSQVSTDAMEAARESVRKFINAKRVHEVVFVKGTTEGINLVAQCFGKLKIKKDDEVIISAMEHHSNIVPWQMHCEQVGAKLRVIPMDERGVLDMEAYKNMLNEKTKIVAITYVSNALGTINPVEEIIASAHQLDVPVLIDAAQAIQHISIDVQALDVDFLVFSGHKMYGPTGIGILYGKESLLNEMPPYQGGGEMIKEVTFEKTTYNDLPFKFEAGTPHIEGIIVLKAAIDYLTGIGLDTIKKYEDELLDYGTELLSAVDGLKIIGTAPEKSSVLSFIVDGVHPYDIGVLLDRMGIAVRTGHHCAEPIMNQFEIPGTVRASLALYNNKEDLDKLIEGLDRALGMLR